MQANEPATKADQPIVVKADLLALNNSRLLRMTVHSAPSRVDLLLRQIKPWNEVNAPGPKCTESGGPATNADPTLGCSECT